MIENDVSNNSACKKLNELNIFYLAEGGLKHTTTHDHLTYQSTMISVVLTG